MRSCLIDGEAVCCEVDGVPSFELLRHRNPDELDAVICGRRRSRNDGPHSPSCCVGSRAASVYPITSRPDGPAVFRHACALGVEGIVSKRKGSPYRSGRTLDWIKVKNPQSPAAKRDAEGLDWR